MRPDRNKKKQNAQPRDRPSPPPPLGGEGRHFPNYGVGNSPTQGWGTAGRLRTGPGNDSGPHILVFVWPPSAGVRATTRPPSAS